MTLDQPPLLLYWTALIVITGLMLFTTRTYERIHKLGIESLPLTTRIAFFTALPAIFFLVSLTLIHATAYLAAEWHAYLRTLEPGQVHTLTPPS